MGKKLEQRKYQEFLLAVGEYIVEYSKAEIHSAFLVNEITKSNKGTMIYRTEINAEQKIKKYKKATQKTVHPSSKNCMRLLGRLDNCRKARNKIAHSVWRYNAFLKKGNILGTSYNMQSKQFAVTILDTDEINKMLARMKILSEDILIEFANAVLLKNVGS